MNYIYVTLVICNCKLYRLHCIYIITRWGPHMENPVLFATPMIHFLKLNVTQVWFIDFCLIHNENMPATKDKC